VHSMAARCGSALRCSFVAVCWHAGQGSCAKLQKLHHSTVQPLAFLSVQSSAANKPPLAPHHGMVQGFHTMTKTWQRVDTANTVCPAAATVLRHRVSMQIHNSNTQENGAANLLKISSAVP
jgi:hypothetical protein